MRLWESNFRFVLSSYPSTLRSNNHTSCSYFSVSLSEWWNFPPHMFCSDCNFKSPIIFSPFLPSRHWCIFVITVLSFLRLRKFLRRKSYLNETQLISPLPSTLSFPTLSLTFQLLLGHFYHFQLVFIFFLFSSLFFLLHQWLQNFLLCFVIIFISSSYVPWSYSSTLRLPLPISSKAAEENV